MSNTVVNVIFGCPINEQISEVLDRLIEEEGGDESDFGFTMLYTSSGERSGYFGNSLDEFNASPTKAVRVKDIAEPTYECKLDVSMRYDELHPDLKAVMGMSTFLVFSNS